MNKYIHFYCFLDLLSQFSLIFNTFLSCHLRAFNSACMVRWESLFLKEFKRLTERNYTVRHWMSKREDDMRVKTKVDARLILSQINLHFPLHIVLLWATLQELNAMKLHQQQHKCMSMPICNYSHTYIDICIKKNRKLVFMLSEKNFRLFMKKKQTKIALTSVGRVFNI
jgi:hypothetical protein